MKGANATGGLWAVPGDWTWQRIEDVAPVNAKRRLDAGSDGTAVSFVPMAAVSEESGQIDVGQRRPAREVRKGYTRFASGDVIFAKITPCMENGKVAIVPALEHGWGAGSTEFHVLTPKQVDPHYLFYWLVRRSFRQEAEFNMTGTAGQKRVPPDYLRNALIAVPPIETQRRIVARIDELFSELDDGEAALAQARADLETYRKSLLKAAVTGALTADWRAANPGTDTGEHLRARLVQARREGWTRELRNDGRRFSEAARPDETKRAIPPTWTWVSLEELTTGGVRNGLSVKESSEPTEVRGLRLDALQSNGIDWERHRFLPITPDRARAYALRDGDLLVSRANGSPNYVGRCTLVWDVRSDTIFPDTAIRYPIVDDQNLRAWAEMAWSAPPTRAELLKRAKSTAGILKVSQGDIAAVPLPLPPLEEVTEILRRVRSARDDEEAGSDDLANIMAAPGALRQSILAAAFRGELT